MIRSNELRKVIAFLMTITLIFMGGAPVDYSYGAENDIRGHWAESVILDAVTAGFVKGYPDGTFHPDQPVTRAEFVSMVNHSLGLREENKVNLLFEDVSENDWYYSEVQKASYAQYIQGVSSSQFAPDAMITRQEAATMLARLLPSAKGVSQTRLSDFRDANQISEWATVSMGLVVDKGYLNGYVNGTLSPLGLLTRAESTKIISQILNQETIERENVSVKVAGEVLKDTIYVGDITIESSVGNGDVDLANLSALSKVYVFGGGTDTVTINDPLIIELI